MFRLLRLVHLLPVFAISLWAAEPTERAEAILRDLISDQNEVLAELAQREDAPAKDDARAQLQQISNRYEQLVRDYPNFAPAPVAYGLLLQRIGMKSEALRLFLRANQLDSQLPLVKNQLGNLIAEAGQPLDALPYFLAAADLNPREPLYHFQIGTLLAEARDDFLATGKWSRAKLDETMLQAFRKAHELAPADWRFAYRLGMAYYDLETPRWDAALALWQSLEPRLTPGLEQQVTRLHQARVLGQLGRRSDATQVLDTVTVPELAEHKLKVLSDLNPSPPQPTPAS